MEWEELMMNTNSVCLRFCFNGHYHINTFLFISVFSFLLPFNPHLQIPHFPQSPAETQFCTKRPITSFPTQRGKTPPKTYKNNSVNWLFFPSLRAFFPFSPIWFQNPSHNYHSIIIHLNQIIKHKNNSSIQIQFCESRINLQSFSNRTCF